MYAAGPVSKGIILSRTLRYRGENDTIILGFEEKNKQAIRFCYEPIKDLRLHTQFVHNIIKSDNSTRVCQGDFIQKRTKNGPREGEKRS